MSKNAPQRSDDGERGYLAWLRLTLVALIIAGYAVLAFGAGVSHADETPGPTVGSTTVKDGADGTPAVSAPTDPVDAAAPPTTTTVTTDESSTSGSNVSVESTGPAATPAGVVDAVQVTGTLSPTKTAGAEPVETVVEESTTQASTSAAPTTSSAPTTSAAPTKDPVSQSNRPESQPPTVEAALAPPPSVDPSPVLRVVASADVRPLAAVPSPAPSLVPFTLPPPNPGQLARQIAGLVSDVSIVAVSAVHTAATTIAQLFGPVSFGGVPYLLATTLANVAAAAGRTIVGGPLADTAGPYPVTYGVLDGLAFFNPTKPPAGANDPNIGVTAQHPLPVILLNGTSATQGTSFSVGAAVLANAGYKVYTFNYGNTLGDPNSPIQAFGDIRQSGLELAAEVTRVLEETQAPQVILVGHSQGGGILPAYYINNLGGAAKVSQLIGIAPSNHGTDIDSLIALQALPIFGPLAVAISNVIGPALYQQALGSPFQDEVYGNGDTRPGVLYTTIASVNDEVVTPYTQQALIGPNVTNIVLQERYPGLIVGHAGVLVSPQVWATVLGALAANPAANPALTSPAFAA